MSEYTKGGNQSCVIDRVSLVTHCTFKKDDNRYIVTCSYNVALEIYYSSFKCFFFCKPRYKSNFMTTAYHTLIMATMIESG